MSKKLLEGVKVIELANFIAAATAGRFLADQGATVIKVESAKGDPLRFTAPSEGRPLDWHENTTWELENANKLNISINTKSEEGRDALFALLEDADVLITNWRQGPLERQGLDYESLKKRFPKLVYAICTGYGENGPDKDLPGFDFTAFFARGGYLETLRQKSGLPMNVVPGTGDHNVGMNLAAGILAALYHARETGQGEKVESSLFETAVFNLGMAIQAAQYKDIGKAFPIDSSDYDNPLLSSWPTKEGRYIQTCMPNYNQYFKVFIATIGHPELADDERYFPIQNLQANGLGPKLHKLISETFKTRTVEEWRTPLVEADIPFSLAQSLTDILDDPQAWDNDCFTAFEYENGNTRTLVHQPVRFAEQGKPVYTRGRFPGEDGPEILRQHGYSQERIDKMLADGSLYVWSE